jgi:hypothetical protein
VSARWVIALAVVACAGRRPPVEHVDHTEVRPELAAWERAWSVARGCFVGTPPLAPDVRDALALRLLAGESFPLCVKELALVPPSREVLLDEAMARLRATNALLDDEEDTEEDTEDEGDGLLAAHDEEIGPAVLALAHAVRDVDDQLATRPPGDAVRIAPATVVATVPLPGVRVVRPDDHSTLRSAVLEHVFTFTNFTDARFFASAPDRFVVETRQSTAQVSARSWGAIATKDAVVAGRLAPDGSLGDRVVIYRGAAQARAAIGEGQRRLVLLELGEELDVDDVAGLHGEPLVTVESRDGGRHWGPPVRLPPRTQLIAATADAFHLHLAATRDRPAEWHEVTADAVKRTVVPEALPKSGKCLAHTRWDELRATGTKSRLHWDEGGHDGVIAIDSERWYIVTCAGDAALLVSFTSRDTADILRCTRAGCEKTVPGAGHWIELTSDGYAWAMQAGHLLRIGQTGKPTVDVRLAEHTKALGLVVWNDVPHVFVIGPDQAQFVRAL